LLFWGSDAHFWLFAFFGASKPLSHEKRTKNRENKTKKKKNQVFLFKNCSHHYQEKIIERKINKKRRALFLENHFRNNVLFLFIFHSIILF
jgi:hypothetical protein